MPIARATLTLGPARPPHFDQHRLGSGIARIYSRLGKGNRHLGSRLFGSFHRIDGRHRGRGFRCDFGTLNDRFRN